MQRVNERMSDKVRRRYFTHSFFHSITLYFLSLGDVNRYISLVLLLAVLVGCGENNRRTARIPPLPPLADSVRTNAALPALNRAINQSSPASAYAKRAVLYLSIGRVREGLADIDEAISRNNNNGPYFLIRANALRLLQQPVKALENAQRAEILGVGTPMLYTLLGDLLQQQNKFSQAKVYLVKALQMAPYDGEAHFFNGLMAARQGDTTQALALYQRSLELKPRYLETYRQLASIYRAMNNLPIAMDYTQRALAYFPGNAELHYSRGLIFHNAGRLDSAITDYQQATKLDAGLYRAYFQMGMIYDKWKSYPAALTNFNRVQQLRPQFPRIDFFIGHCLEQTGQWEPAVAAYTKATQTNPGDQPAYAGLYRAQRRLAMAQNMYTPYLSPTVARTPTLQPTRPGPVLDTSRMRIPTIQPKAKLSTHSDSLTRTIKINE